jgi:hypothetical protein
LTGKRFIPIFALSREEKKNPLKEVNLPRDNYFVLRGKKQEPVCVQGKIRKIDIHGHTHAENNESPTYMEKITFQNLLYLQ